MTGIIKLTVGFFFKGIYNSLSGTIFKKPTQSFKEQANWLLDGLGRLAQGVFELACAVVLPFRLITRAIVTLIQGKPKIENNIKFAKYVERVS